MLVYDITNQKSFDNIRNWIRNIEEVSCCGVLQRRRCRTERHLSVSCTMKENKCYGDVNKDGYLSFSGSMHHLTWRR